MEKRNDARGNHGTRMGAILGGRKLRHRLPQRMEPSVKVVTHFLPRTRPIPRALIVAILREAQSGAQVQLVRSKIVNA